MRRNFSKNFAKLLKQRQKAVRMSLRSKKDRLLSFISLSALSTSVGILILVLCSIINNGYKALTVTKVLLSFDGTANIRLDSETLREDCIHLIRNSLKNAIKNGENSIDLSNASVRKVANSIISETAHYSLVNLIRKGHDISGTSVWLSVSSEFSTEASKAGTLHSKIMKILTEQNRVRTFFNSALFTSSHSKASENAGIIGAMVGSLLTIVVCLVIAIPIGVMSGICMQELLKRGSITSTIEVSINNLASVPSIIFGVLGLIVYLNVFGVPRSSALAGGMTLSLMILPNLIVTTRQAFAAIPESVKHAAFSLGASRMQVIMHHSLPMALPAIVQGIMISVARIIGESSPLIMIGMVAFVVDMPRTFLDPATVLPVQIYIWANNSNVEFTKISAIAIIALLIILLILNMVADLIKKRFDNFSF